MNAPRYTHASTRRTSHSRSRLTQRRRFLGTFWVLGIAALAVFALVTFTSHQSAQAAPVAGSSQGAAVDGRPGGSAIQHVQKNGEPITSDDVVQYVLHTGMPRTLNPGSPMTDVSAQLLTSAQISARLHGESTGFADSTLLWFVQMRGTFVFPGPPGRTPVTAHMGYQVFDSVSGNIVMFGSLG